MLSRRIRRSTSTRVSSRQVRVPLHAAHFQTLIPPRPTVVVGMFFSSMTLLEGKSVRDAKERIQEAYTPTLIRNWCASLYPRPCRRDADAAGPAAGASSSPRRSSTSRSCRRTCASSPSASSPSSGVRPRPLRSPLVCLLTRLFIADAYLSSVNAAKQVEASPVAADASEDVVAVGADEKKTQ